MNVCVPSKFLCWSLTLKCDGIWRWGWNKVAQSCPTLWDPRIQELVAFPFSRGSSQPRDWTQVSRIAGGFLGSKLIRSWVEPSQMLSVPLWEEKQQAWFLSLPCEDTARGQAPVNQQEDFQQESNRPARHLDSGLPRLQNCEEKNVCSLSHPVSGILLLQPELNQTSGNLCFPQIWLLSEIRALQRTWAGGLILQPKALLCTPVQKAWSPCGSLGPGRSVVARVSMQADMTFLSLQSIKLQSLPSLLLLPELKPIWNRQWSSSPSTWHVDSLKGRYLILTFLLFLLLPYLFSYLLL